MKLIHNLKSLCIAVLITSMTGCAGWLDSGPVSRSGTPSFGTVDRDQNDVISREEAANYPSLSGIFNRIDANGDGLLSRSEYHN